MGLVKVIGIDFDNTIVDRDKVLPGAKEALRKLKNSGYLILIHSCNRKEWIERVLNNNEVPYDYIWDTAVDKGKPICNWYVDDRAIGFRGDWNAVLEEIYGEDAPTKTP